MAYPELASVRVVVTGVASGIGRATADALAANGAAVIGLDVREPSTPLAEFHACDLADPRSIARSAAAIAGPVRALCNVAGVPGTLDAERVLAVNVLGLRALTGALLPKFEPGGSIVNVASTAGAGWRLRYAEIRDLLATDGFEAGLAWCREHPRTAAGAYDFSKEVVIVYTKLLASTTARAHGVRANSVSPGAVETPILPDFYASMDNELLDLIKDHCGRNAEPAEVARAIVYLASDASRWVNGLDLVIDGGGEAAFDVGVLRHPLHPTWAEDR
jgi:NAD(P)-dependent dehydrogenase (short-subunit alcohol dehydrogenase family)